MGLLWERAEGFVQIGWGPIAKLPASIDEEIDFDNDKQNDFNVKLDTKKVNATIKPYSNRVIRLQGVYKLTNSIIIRVLLKNVTAK